MTGQPWSDVRGAGFTVVSSNDEELLVALRQRVGDLIAEGVQLEEARAELGRIISAHRSGLRGE